MPIVDRNHRTIAVAKNSCLTSVERAVFDNGSLIEGNGLKVNIARIGDTERPQ